MTSFQNWVKYLCSEAGFKIAELNDRKAVIRFSTASGRVQTLYILKYGSILEFSVPSSAVFNSAEKIPHILSSALLEKNSKYKIGAWCIEQIGDKLVYSIMHNVDINSLNSSGFISLVKFLISECDEFDDFLKHLGSSNPSNYSDGDRGNSFDWGALLQVAAEVLITSVVRNEVDSLFDG